MRNSPPKQCNAIKVADGNFNAEKIATYLASALGYGYIYARQLSSGEYHIEHINTPDDAKKLIGIPTKVTIRYARYCGPGRMDNSKGTRAIIDTDNGARYSVAIRNASGKLVPTEMKIQISKYPSKSLKKLS